MKNQVTHGDTLDVVAPVGGFISGGAYKIGALFGISGFTCAQGDLGVLWLVGGFTLPKLAAQAWTVGALVYWDDTAKLCTTVLTGNGAPIGVSIDVAANPSAFGNVRLNGTFGVA